MQISIFTMLLALIFHMSFNGWYGGNVVGARYQIIALPFWVLGLLYIKLSRQNIYFIAGAGCISIFNMLVINSISTVNRPSDHAYTIFDYYILFAQGQITQWKAPLRLFIPNNKTLSDFAHFHLGELFGLEGLTSFIPLLLAILCATFFIYKQVQEKEAHD